MVDGVEPAGLNEARLQERTTMAQNQTQQKNDKMNKQNEGTKKPAQQKQGSNKQDRSRE